MGFSIVWLQYYSLAVAYFRVVKPTQPYKRKTEIVVSLSILWDQPNCRLVSLYGFTLPAYYSE